MTLKPCIRCGEPSPTTRCDECTTLRPPAKFRDRHAIRSNPAKWKKFSAKLRRMSPFCELCGAASDLTVDHIIPIQERADLVYKVENCRVLCRPCNGRKAGAPPTDAERQAVEQRLESARLRRIRAARSLATQGKSPSDLRVPPLGKAQGALHSTMIVDKPGGDVA